MITIATIRSIIAITIRSTEIIISGTLTRSGIGMSIGRRNIGPTSTGTARRINSGEPTGVGVTRTRSTTIETIATNSVRLAECACA